MLEGESMSREYVRKFVQILHLTIKPIFDIDKIFFIRVFYSIS